MKLVTLIFIFSVLALIPRLSFSDASNSTSNNPRYQMFGGKDNPYVIDTLTGKVWQLLDTAQRFIPIHYTCDKSYNSADILPTCPHPIELEPIRHTDKSTSGDTH